MCLSLLAAVVQAVLLNEALPQYELIPDSDVEGGGRRGGGEGGGASGENSGSSRRSRNRNRESKEPTFTIKISNKE